MNSRNRVSIVFKNTIQSLAWVVAFSLVFPVLGKTTGVDSDGDHEPLRTYQFKFSTNSPERGVKDFLAFLQKVAPGMDAIGAQYTTADMYMDRGLYDEATKLLKNLSEVPTGDNYFQASVLIRLATCCMRLGRFQEAARYYTAVTQSSIKVLVPEAILGLAVATLSAGNIEGAYQHFREMEALYPAYKTHPRTMLPMGLIQWEVRKYEGALNYLLRDDKNPASRYFAALCYRELKMFAQATGLFRRITQEYPESVWADRAQFELGETFYQQGDYLLAFHTFEEIHRLKKTQQWENLSLFRMACCDVRMKRYANAEEKLWILRQRKLDPSLEANGSYLLTESLAAQDKLKKITGLLGRVPEKQRTTENEYRLIWAETAQGDYPRAIQRAGDFLSRVNDTELTPRALLLQAYAYDKSGRKSDAFATYQIIVEHFSSTPYAAKAAELAAMNLYNAGEFKAITTQVNSLWRAVDIDVKKSFPETLYWLGLAYMKLHEYPSAQKSFKEFVMRSPVDHPWLSEGLRAQALAYALDQSSKEALPILQRAFQNAQEKNNKKLTAQLALDMGNISFNAKRYEDAVSYYRRVETVNPESPEMEFALFQQGVALYRADYLDEAVASWEKYGERFPRGEKAPTALFRASRTRFEMGQYSEAVAGFENLIRNYPKVQEVRDARLQIGQCYFNNGEFNKAIESYRDFMTRYPQDPEIAQVNQYLQLASYQSGMSIEEIQVKFPGSKPAVLAEMYWQKGAEAYNAKTYDVALDFFQKLLYEFPNSSWAPQASFYRGECLFFLEKFAESVGAYETFLQSYPTSVQRPLAEFHLGVSYFNRNNYERSATLFRDFAESYPSDPLAQGALLNAAISFSRTGDVPKTTEAYMNYAGNYPKADDVGAAWIQLGQFLEKYGRESGAIEAYTRVTNERPEYPQALYFLAKLYRILGDSKGERNAYERLQKVQAKNDPYRISGLLGLADLAVAANDAQEAMAVYRDVAKNATDQASRELAEKQISAIQNVLTGRPPTQNSPKGSK